MGNVTPLRIMLSRSNMLTLAMSKEDHHEAGIMNLLIRFWLVTNPLFCVSFVLNSDRVSGSQDHIFHT